MAETKHIPGPWNAEPIPAEAHTDPDMMIPEGDLFWIVDTRPANEVIATVHMAARGEAEANAKLIARAPSMAERLHLITRAALDRIDGDSQSDTHWAEIVGIAEGDPNWLQHAKANYEKTHAEIVRFSMKLIEHVIENLDGEETMTVTLVPTARMQHIAEYMADLIEQDLLPVQFLAEDGRTFLRSQGKPYPREEAAK